MSTRLFTGALFDLDGVLIDSHAAIVALWHGLAARLGRRISDGEIERHVLGCAPEHTVAALFSDLDDAGREGLLEAVRAAEPDLAFVAVAGATELVGRLHTAGVPLGLVTGASADRAGRVLDVLGLRTAFPVLVTWGEVDRGKPAPDCYLLGADRLGHDPASCLVFEDAPSGVTAAVRAGAACVGVGDESSLSGSGATWTAPGLAAVGCRVGADGVVLDLSGTPVARLVGAASAADRKGAR
ncbi:HAD family phosphatase [Solwaraspora sp. WMMD937]|uniref:HAD family hydrolase n=1 Tax=Solwaraspora sp. WMMD937 TaxID=3016090 RepID=UPI00249B0DD5|nr:HAD family phosphatase [Solwaraspora sp. WMMD937]WFE20060.1 HAD family phosphatase [Solwaraspora sp. WMMD937]